MKTNNTTCKYCFSALVLASSFATQAEQANTQLADIMSIESQPVAQLTNLASTGFQLVDSCASESPFTGRTITNGDTVCLPDSSSRYLTIANANQYNSVAISTGYGSGDLSLYAKNGGWPRTDGSDPSSTNAGNGECIILTNPSSYWTYISVMGAAKDASLVVELGATQCRTTGDTPPPPPPTDGDGYQYNYAHIKVYRFEFSDTPLNWPTMQEELDKTVQYYQEQSYGKFTVSYDISTPTIKINQPKSTYDNDFHGWTALWKSKIAELGVDPDNPGAGSVVMMVAPQVGNYNSSAAPPSITLYHHTAGVIAHELGHALGLRHAKALEAGPGKVIGVGDYNSESLNYGNVYSMMGMGAHSLQEYNLLYKHYFGWLSDSDVPVINSSGTYRIYAFDHASNNNGNIGLRLKSGNGLYTYWLEYRTTNNSYPNTQNGVLINLQGYFENETDERFWKTTSYLLDMTPGSKTPGWWGDDQTDSELVIGKSYTDHWGGFKITPVSKGGTPNSASAWIEIKVEML
ncbi:collagenase [Pseudoalteromonas sp. S16_S37]|uniref:collagenase n=1 Tax=Pseudoalteromonas sp. S16_S37 TaxID=2720228 RepID=UPI001EEEBFFD|nr:collagenase [Pseudoalteromonas sp. S16_S37]